MPIVSFASITADREKKFLREKGTPVTVTNKVVIHYKDGKISKGTTADFLPKKRTFHLIFGEIHGQPVKEIFVDDLKAVFFVKDFIGNRHYREAKGFGNHPRSGKRVRAIFKDGETLYGYTHVINLDQPGFFLVPADLSCNNERAFIVYSSLRKLEVNDCPVELRGIKRR